VAGAVLQAARLSANLTKNGLAAATGVTRNTIRSWENGSSPLASVPAPDVQRLETALGDYGASQHLVADLTAAAWCDLIITATNDDEDISCLLADPITGEHAFRELLTWSLTGHTPARYRRYFAPSPLITSPILVDRAFHSVTAIHPALAADCLSAPVVTTSSQPRALHNRRRAHDRQASTARMSWQHARRPRRIGSWQCRRQRR
jgi:transcriptional regulator with XRE-family HTH domain